MKVTSIFQTVSALGGQAHPWSGCCWCLMGSGGGGRALTPAADNTAAPTAVFSKGLPLSSFNCFGVRSSSQQPGADDL